MKFKQSIFAAGALAAATLIGTTIHAQMSHSSDRETYGSGSAGGASTTALPCPLENTPEAAGALCVSVVIPPGATGTGSAAYGVNPLNVNLGTTVIWLNLDSTAHTVTATDGSFDSGSLAPGQYFSHSFNSAGTYTYYDTIYGNSSMNGSVVVSSSPVTSSGYVTPSSGANCFTPGFLYPNFPYPYHPPIPIPPTPPRPSPSVTPSASPSVTPSPSPSVHPSPSPSVSPSSSPSSQPIPHPTITPIPFPLVTPSP